MSFVSFWKNTKNGICLFLEKNSKLNVFEKQVNLDLTLFGKKQKMSFVSFWNEPNVAAAQCRCQHILQVSLMAGFEPCQKGNVAAAQCWCRPQSANPPQPPPSASTCLLAFTVLRHLVVHNRRCRRLLPRSKGVIMLLSIGTQR